jgi:formate C-acetyltransferase
LKIFERSNKTMERREFVGGKWQLVIDVRDFIQKNYTLYEGDARFLAGPTEKTQKVWARCLELLNEELKKGVLDVETNKVSGICNFEPGYIDRENEVIVGLQTDAPLRESLTFTAVPEWQSRALKNMATSSIPQ